MSLRFVFLILLAVACKKPVPPEGPIAVPEAPPEEPAKKPDAPPPPAPAPDTLERAYFALDVSNLDASARRALDRNVDLLKRVPEARVEIQGHCDERGTTDYNVALGDRRASAAKKYLVAQGIAASRLTTVSYGEEKPASFGHEETDWAANRRVELRILSGGDATLVGSVP